MFFIRIIASFKSKIIPLVYWLVQYRLHYIECKEAECRYKGMSKRVVSILNIGLLIIILTIISIVTKEYGYVILGFIGAMLVMTFFGSERCPRCMGSNFRNITREEYLEYQKEYEDLVDEARKKDEFEENFINTEK